MQRKDFDMDKEKIVYKEEHAVFDRLCDSRDPEFKCCATNIKSNGSNEFEQNGDRHLHKVKINTNK